MRIYFIRHSETECNARHLFYGHMDVPINANGRRQAELLGQFLENVTFDRIYASDLLRVQQTMRLVLDRNIKAAACMPEIVLCPKLREIDFGLWEGKTYAEIAAAFPEDAEQWANDWEHSKPTGGESFVHFKERISAAFFNIVQAALAQGMAGKTILIAAHNGALQAIFAAMLGLPMRGMWHFQFEQAAYSVVDFECDNYTIRKINSQEYIY